MTRLRDKIDIFLNFAVFIYPWYVRQLIGKAMLVQVCLKIIHREAPYSLSRRNVTIVTRIRHGLHEPHYHRIFWAHILHTRCVYALRSSIRGAIVAYTFAGIVSVLTVRAGHKQQARESHGSAPTCNGAPRVTQKPIAADATRGVWVKGAWFV